MNSRRTHAGRSRPERTGDRDERSLATATGGKRAAVSGVVLFAAGLIVRTLLRPAVEERWATRGPASASAPASLAGPSRVFEAARQPVVGAAAPRLPSNADEDLEAALATGAADVVRARLGSWTARDPAAAWAWALAHRGNFAGGVSPMRLVLARIAAFAPEQVAAFTNDAFDREVANAAVEALLDVEAIDVAEQTLRQWMLDGRTRPRLDNVPFEKIALALERRSSAEAAAWLQSLPISEPRNFAMATFAANWSQRDPAAAMRWAAGLAPADGRADAMERVFARWSSRDLVAAAAWVAENESDPLADTLIANLAGDSPLGWENPQVAQRWAGLIENPNARKSLEGLLRQRSTAPTE